MKHRHAGPAASIETVLLALFVTSGCMMDTSGTGFGSAGGTLITSVGGAAIDTTSLATVAGGSGTTLQLVAGASSAIVSQGGVGSPQSQTSQVGGTSDSIGGASRGGSSSSQSTQAGGTAAGTTFGFGFGGFVWGFGGTTARNRGGTSSVSQGGTRVRPPV
jgi:hypothetical protein